MKQGLLLMDIDLGVPMSWYMTTSIQAGNLEFSDTCLKVITSICDR